MKTLLLIFSFSIVFPNIQKDLEDALGLGKMGPASERPSLDLHPPPGGIEGISPIYGSILPSPTLHFIWRGREIVGEKPALFLFEEGKPHAPKTFFVRQRTHHVSLAYHELGLERGKEYRWYLGRLEVGKPIAQTRVFFFRILSDKEIQNLEKDLLQVGRKDFLKAQIFYNYRMYHNMVDVLESLKKKYRSPAIRKLLFLGYVRLGRHAEAKKYEIKN